MTAVVRGSRDSVRPPTAQTYFLQDSIASKSPSMLDYDEPIDSSVLPSRSPGLVSSPPSSPSSYAPTVSSVSANGDDGEDESAQSSLDTPDCAGERTPAGRALTTAVRSSPVRASIGDDSSIEDEPDRHVDYLSHDWREEDIWASWRYVVSRRDQYSNGVRLENASWRSWAKAKNNLRTISPEKLNWMKDCDVTWLYGPLQTGRKQRRQAPNQSPPPSGLSSSNSFMDRKPILKKRTASEAILQRSLSQHTLLKHASAILQAQKAEHARSRPGFGRATSDEGVPFGRRRHYFDSTDNTSTSSDVTPSGLVSPSERRHIHFNNEVSQCIAVETKDDHDDVDPSDFFLGEESDDGDSESDDDEGDDDDGLVMMKQLSRRPSLSGRSAPRRTSSSESKTIAPLPPTTLKYRSDTPEPPQDESTPPQDQFSPTSSVETLRPQRPEANFLLDDDNDRGAASHDRPWFVNPADSWEHEQGDAFHITSPGSFSEEDDDSAESPYTGLFGRVIDTINTARDIAHVIWNVGWRQ